MWTLSGFADEIDPDPETQCRVLNELGIAHIELRSAWDVNVLDLTDEQLDEVEHASWPRTTSRCRRSAHPSARSTSRTTSTPTCCGWTGPWPWPTASAPRTSGSSRSSCAPDQAPERPPRRGDPPDARPGREGRSRPASCCCTRTRRTSTATSRTGCSTSSSRWTRPALQLAWDPANYVQVRRHPVHRRLRRLRPTPSTSRSRTRCWPPARSCRPARATGRSARPSARWRADGFDGFFSMEPHLGTYNSSAASPAPTTSSAPPSAFTTILDSEGIEYA